MTRTEVRALLPSAPEVFQKGACDPTETDDYSALGMYLSYDADDRLWLIETFPPCVPTFEGMTFTNLPAEVGAAAMQARGYEAVLEAPGGILYEASFPQVGITLNIRGEGNTVETVEIHRRGYHE